jgi:hypothetical protein
MIILKQENRNVKNGPVENEAGVPPTQYSIPVTSYKPGGNADR